MLTLCAVLAFGPMGAGEVEFNRDIRPILSENCFRCHGPDSAARKADLRLDRREAALRSGAFVPGKPDESELVRRIFSTEPEVVMPHPSSRKTLTGVQKDLLRRWIAAGAEYQPHWSFLPPRRPPPPAVKDAAWVKNPADNFLLAKLEEHGLHAAAEADPPALARRLSLDLTGLPPSPDDGRTFVTDPSPDAYERLADRLLASVHWGEHRGRYWLDAARYADTHGIHFDNFREMWSYRDWVIDAFNRNLPFDRFTIEQLAGDLLGERTLESQVASGFNRCNMTTNEGGVIPEEYLVHYTRDRTETTSQIWLGLTANCAVCHDHKFDPLSQREFYEMAAFFNNTTQGAMDGNIKDTPPVIPVPGRPERDRWQVLGQEIAGAKQAVDARRQAARADFETWLGGRSVEGSAAEAMARLVPATDLRLHGLLDQAEGNSVPMLVDGCARAVSLATGPAWEPGHVAAQAFRTRAGAVVELAEAGDFEKDQAFSCGAWVKLAKTDAAGSIVARMDDEHDHRGWDLWFEKGRIGSHLVHAWDKDALKAVTREALKAGEWTHVFMTYDGSGKAAGILLYVNGRAQDANRPLDRLAGTIRTGVPLKVSQRHTSSRLDDLAIQDLRIYGRALTAEEVKRIGAGTRAAWLAAKSGDQRPKEEVEEIFGAWLGFIDEPHRAIHLRLAALEQEKAALQARGTFAHVMQERNEAPTAHILYRGEYDQRRDAVKAGTPDILPPMPADLPRNRLGFARWILGPEQPLTARVTVNRMWQEVFGTGIVRTAGDFGVSGELPSHPDLLDWLAVELRESGWDVKRFYRLLVTSSAYRQAAVSTPEKLERDPHNRLLSRGPRFRMDGEMIRDQALAASDLLVRKISGPSVKPYQPEGVWEAVAMMESNTRYYQQDSGENLYRRSLYTFWKRAAPPASMDVFNAPNREVCTVRRERTNTPLQALVTLNDVQFVEAARHLAEQVLREGRAGSAGRLDAHLAGLAQRLLARPFRKDEVPVVEASLLDLLAYYRTHPDDAKELIAVGESQPDPSLDPATLAGFTMLANQLMNLDEVLNK